MNVNKEKKESLIKEISDAFEQNDSFYLLDFVNMPVSKAAQFRRQIRENSHGFKVVKNRLALRAFLDDFPEELKDFFQGPTAIAYTARDPIGLARLIKEFSAEHKILAIKAGLVEGKFLSKDMFNEIANLASKQDLLAKIGFLISLPLTKLLRTWQAPLTSLGSMLSQLKSNK